ncbi:MAG: sodium:proton antiporter [Frankiales bacterium]|nr:sodium:proton antiporter [Frankiales bacterium]
MTASDATFLVLGGVALVAAVVPRLVAGRPVSLPLIFLLAGVGLGLLPGIPFEVDPLEHRTVAEHLTEVTVLVALMGTGLALDRPPGLRRWAVTWRLLGLAMPLTIAAVALLGDLVLGLAPAAALLLGAALAPTDPVLAGEVQVGEPTTDPVGEEALQEAEDEVPFALTSEAGLNDALAFPFVYAAVLVAEKGTDAGSWLLRWVAYEVAYKIAAGLAVGVATGWLIGRLAFSARRRTLRLSEHREGSVALGATALAYGLAEVASGYGFLAVFAAAVAIRGSERFHEYHRDLHQFTEQIERLLTVLVLLLLGMALADGVLAGIGPAEVAVAVAVVLVVRPVAGALALIGSGGTRGERAATAFFGVRGVGSFYYVAYALGVATFTGAHTLWAVVALVVTLSVVIHGISAGPVMSALDRAREAEQA